MLRMKLATTAVLALTLAVGAQAAGEQQLHSFGSWAIVTWKTPGGHDVYWAQTALDSKHLLEETDDGDHLRFGCNEASRPMTVVLLAEGSRSAGWTDYTVDWRVGNFPPIRGTGKRMTIFDLFDSPEATKQMLEGEQSSDLLVLRLSNPEKGTSRFTRSLVGTEWPKLYVAKLDGFKRAHDFVVEKCKEERTQEALRGDVSLEPELETTRQATNAPSRAVDQPEQSPRVAVALDSVRSSVIARCREAMGDYGAAMVKACVDQDLAAYVALARYSGHEAEINRCRRDMESYGWAMVKACVDQDVEAEKSLGE